MLPGFNMCYHNWRFLLLLVLQIGMPAVPAVIRMLPTLQNRTVCC